jgi:hypothetical protein
MKGYECDKCKKWFLGDPFTETNNMHTFCISCTLKSELVTRVNLSR